MARIGKFLKRAAIILGGLIAVLLIINAILISVAARRLERQIAAIRAAGEPITLADLASPPPPADENAATFLRRAQHDLDAVTNELNVVYGRDGFHTGRLDPADLDTIRDTLQAYPNLIPLLQRAADAPHYDPQHNYYAVDPQSFLEDLLDFQQARAATRLLVAHTQLMASQDDHDEALRSCLTMFRLCRHFDQEPALISQLVVLACQSVAVSTTNRVLRSGPVSLELRQSLDAELAQHTTSASYVQTLKTERVIGLENFQMYLDQIAYWPVRAAFLNDAAAYLDLMDRQLQLADRPYREYLASEGDSHANATVLHPLTDSVRSGMMQARLASDRVRALLRSLRVLNAAQAHVQRTGETPVSLADLDIPAEATTDPFTAEPLKFAETAQGWLVYSVGENLSDDGGDLEAYRDVGVGPPHSDE